MREVGWKRLLRLAGIERRITDRDFHEGEGTVLTLQNMSMKELIGLRPLVPPGTVRVLLMPKRELWDDGTGREKLLFAYAGLDPKTLP